MNAPIYYDASSPVKKMYQVDGMCLTIRSHSFKGSPERAIPFSQIWSVTRKNKVPSLPRVVATILMTSPFVWFTLWVLKMDEPANIGIAILLQILSLSSAAVAASGIWFAFKARAPVDILILHDMRKKPLLLLMRRKEDGEAFDVFVSDLLDRFSKFKGTAPNQAPLPTPVSVTPAADAPVAPDTGAAEL